MAAKKVASKKKAVAKRTGTAVSKWQSRIAQYTENFGSREKEIGGNRISLKGSKFKMGQVDLGAELDVVILDYSMFNAHFDSDYDPDSIVPPVCFAIARDEADLKPVEGCSAPQSEACDGCWANEYESAPRGKGKACGNKRRVAVVKLEVIEAAIAGEGVLTAEDVAIIEFGGTSIGAWTSYVNKVAKRLNLPAFMVRTQLTFDPVPDYPKLEFGILPDQIDYDDVTGEALMDIIDGLDEQLLHVPNLKPSEDEDNPAKASRAAPQKKRASSKKVASKKVAAKRRSRLS